MPVTLFCFGLALAGLWSYAKYAESKATSRVTYSPHRDPLADPELTALAERNSRSGIFLPPPEFTTKPPRKIEPAASASVRPNASPVTSETGVSKPVTRPKRRIFRPAVDLICDQVRFASHELKMAIGAMDDAAVRWRSNLGGGLVAMNVDGWNRIREGRADVAVEKFNRILYRDPENLAALAGKAQALMALHRYTEALATYQFFLKLRPDDADAWYTRGVMLIRASQPGEAAEHFRKATRLNPLNAKAWYNLAAVAQRDGRLAEARDAWLQFTKLEPSIASGWFNLGAVYMDFMKPDEAAKCFSYVVMIDPGDIDGYVNLAEAYRATGDYEAALSVLEQTGALSPCDPVVMSVMAETHRAMASMFVEHETEHLMAAAELDELAATASGNPGENRFAIDDASDSDHESP